MCSMFTALQYLLPSGKHTQKKTIETCAISPGLLYKWWIIQWLRIDCVRLLEAIYLICVHSRWLKPSASGHFKSTAGNAWDETTKIIHQFPGMIWTMYRFWSPKLFWSSLVARKWAKTIFYKSNYTVLRLVT
jgi:hypothetical protein